MKSSILKAIQERLKILIPSDVRSAGNHNASSPDQGPLPVSEDLKRNLDHVRSILAASDDIVFRNIDIATPKPTQGTLIYIDNLIDQELLETSIILPLTEDIRSRILARKNHYLHDIEKVINNILHTGDITYYEDHIQVIDEILAGNCILFINGYGKAVGLNIARADSKEDAEPKTERIVKGPQQGFVEDIFNNVRIVRKKIKSPNLIIKGIKIGRETKSDIKVVYLKNIADPSIVEELFSRLNRIDVDGVVGSSNIDDFINDSPRNLFPTTFNTERPDRVSAMLLEGRIAIICDQTPFVIMVPAIITDFYISTEDYYINPYFATFNRLIRYLGSLIVMFLPGIYVAVSTFHQEMIPTRLALTVAGTRSGVPYPAFVETLLMETAFEALREAGIRLPIHIGQAVSIVGALIIGQAAVEAGLVSPAVVIIVAATAIFSFTIPFTNFSLSLRLTRFFIMTLAAILGIYGLMTAGLIITLNLVALRSLGVPFTTPFAPLSLQDMKDWVLRLPQWAITKRSRHIIKGNYTKQVENLEPSPHQMDRRKEK